MEGGGARLEQDEQGQHGRDQQGGVEILAA